MHTSTPWMLETKGYNGIISIEGEKIKVSEGVFEYDGESYYISDDGSMVVDRERNIIGRIENGIFKEIDDDQLTTLRNKGILEE